MKGDTIGWIIVGVVILALAGVGLVVAMKEPPPDDEGGGDRLLDTVADWFEDRHDRAESNKDERKDEGIVKYYWQKLWGEGRKGKK
jgi:hypothetical protein